MESLLHYTWRHKLFVDYPLTTTRGSSIEVLHPGLPNYDAGPDFLGAKILIDGVEWVGNVEIHVRTSDWYRHHHDENERYDNIILHVVGVADDEVCYHNGVPIPQMVMTVPEYVRMNYEGLVGAERSPKCADIISSIPTISIHSWLSALQIERLQQRTQQIMERRARLSMSWEDTLFATLARSMGMGRNGDAFEQWVLSFSLSSLAKHRDSLFQVESVFFGQAGLLPEGEPTPNPSQRGRELEDGYCGRLRSEYGYMRRKFGLEPMGGGEWKLLRMRPQAFPHVKLAQLAMMYYEQRVSMSAIVNAGSVEDVMKLLDTHVSEYWRTHYMFGREHGRPIDGRLSRGTKVVIMVNCVVPVLFAYGRYKGDEGMCERALRMWEELPAEKNSVIADWMTAGVVPDSAANSQALLQLHSEYCQKGECLRCRLGKEYIGRNPGFLRENTTME